MTTEANTAELELVPPQDGEAPMKQLAPFSSFKEQAEKLKLTAETLAVTDASDRKGMQLARSTRLSFREIRIAVEHRRKELGEEALRTKQKIDADAKTMKDFCEAQETRLLEMEQFAEREAARIQDEKRTARSAELSPFLTAAPIVDLGTLSDEQYAGMLSDAKDAHAARMAREQKEKEEAAAKAKAEAEERERIRLENERLKKEATEREEQMRVEREKAEAEARKAREEKERAEAAAKAERERIEREHQAKLEAERKAAEEKAEQERRKAAAERAATEAKAKKEREAAEAKAKAEREKFEAEAKRQREAREKIESELAAKKAAEEKAAADKRAAEEAAALAPEKDKLKAFAASVRALVVPTLETEKGVAAAKEITAKVESFANWIEKQAAAL